MRNITSKIVRSLNEALDNPTNEPVVTNEDTVGVVTPKEVHQCEKCSAFYLVNESVEVSQCPECGGDGKLFRKLEEVQEIEPEPEQKAKLTEEEEEELKSEADLVVSEALKLLDNNDYRKFNESYRSRVKVNTKGELEALVESKNGKSITSSRKMTSRQKSAYRLSERYTPAPKANSKKLESIKLHRQVLRIKNESRAVKLQACKILERQGAKYDFTKFNESLNKFINERFKINRRILEDIADDEEVKSELDNMTTDEIADQVEAVIKDTGLEVINKDVDVDGDTATVSIRVEDNDQEEVHTAELEDVLSDVFEKPVEIVGPNQSEGDKSVVDLAVVINPDEPQNEDLDPEDPPEDPEIPAADPEDLEKDPEKPLSECDDPELKKNKSVKVNEKFAEGTGNTPLFALKAIESAGNAPEFLAHDDSVVSGNEENAEDLARVFVSEEAAKKYLDSAGIADKFIPVSITIVTNESLEDPKSKEDDEVFENEDGFFKKDKDGNVVQIDESEYNAKKDMSSEVNRIKESMKRRRRVKR